MAAKKAAVTPNMGRKTKSKADSSSSSSSLFTSSSTSSNSNKDSGNNNIFFVSYQFGSAFSLLYTAIRIGTANLSPITDCDEVYNYWEPLHFLLYGSGMQTWEYAPQYALRTYAYLIPMAMLARCLQYMMKILPTSLLRQLPNLLLLRPTITTTAITTLAINDDDDKPLLFALLRSSLALLSSYSELSFLHSIHTSISPIIAHWTAFTSLTSSGLFHANPAYLPSSTIMILWRLSISNQLRGYDNYAIIWGLMAVLAVGWPFCAVLFVTTGIWSLWNAYTSVASIPSEVGGNNNNDVAKTTTTNIIRMRRIRAMAHVLIRTAIHTILIQGVIMTIDYYYYGRIVSPIWNIFVYNATAGGDELYGVEPLSYYIKNLLLNFNFVALLGVVSLPLVLGRIVLARMFPQATFIGRRSSGGGHDGKEDSSMTMTTTEGRKIMMLIPMYIWMAIVFPRPHKEERFLFPIYPMLCFGSSIALEEIMTITMAVLSLIRPKKLKGPSSSTKLFRLLLGFVLLTPFAVISISRSMALHHNYSAPLDVYRHYYYHHNHEVVQKRMVSATQQNEPEYYVCTAGEWYRFPSSFFLPSNTQLGFLKSSFTGQLPQPFTALGSKEESLTIQEGKFNDMNREEMDRYTEFNQCSYVVELVPSSSSSPPRGSYAYDDKETTALPECLQYMKSDVNSERSWTQVASYKYLDAESTEALHRILYIPFRRTDKVRYKGYNLYSMMGGGE